MTRSSPFPQIVRPDIRERSLSSTAAKAASGPAEGLARTPLRRALTLPRNGFTVPHISQPGRVQQSAARAATYPLVISKCPPRTHTVWDFDKIYRTHVRSLFRYSLSLAGSRTLAEDVTSEAFLALLRHRDTVEEDRLPSWLFTVAKNKILDHWRRKATEQQYCEQWAPEPDNVPAVPWKIEILENKALKPVHRACLTLRYVHGMSRQEIAAETGLSEMQVKGCLQYALEILRKELSKDSHDQRTETAME